MSFIINNNNSWITQTKINPNESLKIIYIEHRVGCINWISSQYDIGPEDARDIFQSAVVVLYENVMENKIKKDDVKLRPYLIGICKNLSYSWLRKENKRVKYNNLPIPILIDYMYSELINEEEKIEKYLFCKRSMKELGNPCSQLLTMFYFEGKTMKEIKDILGHKNDATTKTQKYKCMNRLREIMNRKKNKITI